MTMHAYQQEVLRTLAGTEQRAIAETGLSQENIALLTVFSLGVTGEAGEVADIVKKVVGHGHPLDRAALVKELGDVLWYVAAIAHVLGSDLDEVAAANIAKLRKRFPDGFTSAASRTRVDEGERVLEASLGRIRRLRAESDAEDKARAIAAESAEGGK